MLIGAAVDDRNLVDFEVDQLAHRLAHDGAIMEHQNASRTNQQVTFFALTCVLIHCVSGRKHEAAPKGGSAHARTTRAYFAR